MAQKEKERGDKENSNEKEGSKGGEGNNCLLTHLIIPVCNWAIFRLVYLC